MNPALPLDDINGTPLTLDQRRYLTGFFAGVAARGIRFDDVEPSPVDRGAASPDDLIFEERVKRELHPLDAYPQLVENAAANRAPDKEELFRFKWHGLFYLAPGHDGFMARLRIPGGFLNSFQLRELAAVARELTSGYVQITTRANLQMRLIEPKNAPAVLRRIQSVGLHTRGAGADNIRNITANPTAGVDPLELIDVTLFCLELAQLIINDRAFYNLPRKFNIAFDGGGLIGTVEDTNDIGVKAVAVGNEIHFRLAVGGATGHKAFANDLGTQVRPSEVIQVIAALVRVFVANGNRTDRKRARLKHLLETWSLDQYLEETEKQLGRKLPRVPLDPAALAYPGQKRPHTHVGVYPQKQAGLNYVGVAVPVGQLTPKQMRRLAEIAELYGSGEVRLTVWQNLILPNISDGFVETVKKALRRIGFATETTPLRGGLVACTGNSFCKYAQANTKTTAQDIVTYLEKKLSLDQPINIHLTGCPNSCAQHYMGDIGLLATKTRHGEGFHVFVGGGFGAHQAVGRQVFTGVSVGELPATLERMLSAYLARRMASETFQQFTARHDLNGLQVMFTNGE
ncbi:MAG: NirA family protein [Verrucomicrobiota bacterium]